MSDSERDTGNSAADVAADPEPRAGAVVRGEVDREALDPVTAAQLAAWFGAPATGVTVDTAPEEETSWDTMRRERDELNQRIADDADPRLMQRVQAWAENNDELVRLPPPMPPLAVEREIAHLDMSVWRIRSVELHETMRPEDINDAMHEVTPQAILRDLHRPIMSWPALFISQDVGVDIAGLRGVERIRETTNTSYRIRMERELIASQMVYRDMSELAGHLDEPWDEIEIPEERRTSTSLGRTPEDLMWFGAIGYDPTI